MARADSMKKDTRVQSIVADWLDRFGSCCSGLGICCDGDRTLNQHKDASVFKCLLTAALIALSPTTVIAGEFEDGLAAAQRGDHQEAFGLWQPLAQSGDPKSQLNLGLMYENGHGVAKSHAKAAEWYHKAAGQGLARAQARLGIMYHLGRGVSKDYIVAVQWYRSAAEQGNADAQSNLGGSYGNGQGVEKDYVLAHMWLSLAAAQGLKAAAQNRSLIAKRMTPAQLDKAQKLVDNWQVQQQAKKP